MLGADLGAHARRRARDGGAVRVRPLEPRPEQQAPVRRGQRARAARALGGDAVVLGPVRVDRLARARPRRQAAARGARGIRASRAAGKYIVLDTPAGGGIRMAHEVESTTALMRRARRATRPSTTPRAARCSRNGRATCRRWSRARASSAARRERWRAGIRSLQLLLESATRFCLHRPIARRGVSDRAFDCHFRIGDGAASHRWDGAGRWHRARRRMRARAPRRPFVARRVETAAPRRALPRA